MSKEAPRYRLAALVWISPENASAVPLLDPQQVTLSFQYAKDDHEPIESAVADGGRLIDLGAAGEILVVWRDSWTVPPHRADSPRVASLGIDQPHRRLVTNEPVPAPASSTPVYELNTMLYVSRFSRLMVDGEPVPPTTADPHSRIAIRTATALASHASGCDLRESYDEQYQWPVMTSSDELRSVLRASASEIDQLSRDSFIENLGRAFLDEDGSLDSILTQKPLRKIVRYPTAHYKMLTGVSLSFLDGQSMRDIGEQLAGVLCGVALARRFAGDQSFLGLGKAERSVAETLFRDFLHTEMDALLNMLGRSQNDQFQRRFHTGRTKTQAFESS